MGLSEIGSAEWRAEQAAMRQMADTESVARRDDGPEWVSTDENERRADHGAAALAAYDPAWMADNAALTDMLANLMHAAARAGMDMEDITTACRLAADHFDFERTGAED